MTSAEKDDLFYQFAVGVLIVSRQASTSKIQRTLSISYMEAVELMKRAEREGGGVVPVCAKLESELVELDTDDRAEMLEAVGLEQPALHQLAAASYKLLGLQSYFTAGEKEVRAWTIPVGATGPQAAGVIHTDFERGFIRRGIDCWRIHWGRFLRRICRLNSGLRNRIGNRGRRFGSFRFALGV